MMTPSNRPLARYPEKPALPSKAPSEAPLPRDDLIRAAIENAPDAIVITEAAPLSGDGPAVIFANDAYLCLTGQTREEVLGTTASFSQSDHLDETMRASILDALRKGEACRFEMLRLRRDQRSLWVDVAVFPIPDETGAITHIAAFERDISDQKQLVHTLRQAQATAEAATQAKGEFLATMSHEIRTPLTAIIGMTRILAESGLNPVQKRQAITAARSAEALLHLINDILDFSRMDAGALELESVAFDVSDLVGDIVELFAIEAKAKGLSCIARYGPDIPRRIEADPGRLRQILYNLVGNAIKFTATGQVTVCVDCDEARTTEAPEHTGKAMLVFRVSDTGIGIPAEKQAGIFERFSQADTSIARKYGGSGLGLAISQRLAAMMGGDITLESEEGKGSTFTLRVPVMIAGPASGYGKTAGEALNDGTVEPRLDGLRLLLAEDNPVNADIFCHLVEGYGCRVRVTGNGRHALDIAQQEPFDLIIMDCQMPEMDGYEAARRLSDLMAQGEITEVPIIAFTARAMAGDRERCLAAGMSDYLPKPIVPQTLRAVLLKWAPARVRQTPSASSQASFQAMSETPALIDEVAFEACREMLGKAFTTVIARFLETSAGYLEAIATGVEQENPSAIAKAAHPLKSAAAQLGLARIAVSAGAIERLTRETAWDDLDTEALRREVDILDTAGKACRERLLPYAEAAA